MIDDSYPLSRCGSCGSQQCVDDCGSEVEPEAPSCISCGKRVEFLVPFERDPWCSECLAWQAEREED